MEVHVDRDAFLKGLQMVHNVVEPRQTLPILANVLLESDGDTLRLTATDLEVGARVSVPAKVPAGGSITMSARKLLEIVKELPAAGLSLKVQDNAWVALRCGGASYKLVGLGAADFPAVSSGEAAAWITLDGKLLRDMLAQTTFAISHDESRYALNGVLFAVQEREIRLVATDGHRLALAVRPLAGAGGQVSGIVPRKAVQEIARVVGTGEDVQVAMITDTRGWFTGELTLRAGRHGRTTEARTARSRRLASRWTAAPTTRARPRRGDARSPRRARTGAR